MTLSSPRVSDGRVRFLRSPEADIAEVRRAGCAGLGPVFYAVRVSVAGSQYARVVERRYSCFSALHSKLRPRLPGLPPMPKKSVFRRRVLPAFMAERRRLLLEVLRFAVASDPLISDPDIRAFLGDALPCCLEDLVWKSRIVGCAEEQEKNAKDADSTHEGDWTNCSDDDEQDMPRSFEIVEKLGSLRATNAVLEFENTMINHELLSLCSSRGVFWHATFPVAHFQA